MRTFFSVEISWDGNGWIKGNIGQTGFYRVNYDDNNWNILVTQLKHNHKVHFIMAPIMMMTMIKF